VKIETPTGKAEYVAGQRRFAEAGQLLRRRVLDALDVLDVLDVLDGAAGSAGGAPAPQRR